MRAYMTDTGTRLYVINGEGLGEDDPDQPIPYRPVLFEDDGRDPAALAARVDELERLLDQSRDLENVWEEVAQQLQQRCEQMFTDLARLTGRSRASVRAQYVPEVTEGAPDPA